MELATATAKFDPGHVVMTPGVEQLITIHPAGGLEPFQFKPWLSAILNRHLAGDWGDVPPEDAQFNDEAVGAGARLMSSYEIQGEAVWIVTEADRSSTLFTLPSEY